MDYLNEKAKIEKIEADDELKDMTKYVMAFRTSPHIYNLIGAKISPEEYMATITEEIYPGNITRVTRVGDYNYAYYNSEIEELNLEEQDYIFIISPLIFGKQLFQN